MSVVHIKKNHQNLITNELTNFAIILLINTHISA